MHKAGASALCVQFSLTPPHPAHACLPPFAQSAQTCLPPPQPPACILLPPPLHSILFTPAWPHTPYPMPTPCLNPHAAHTWLPSCPHTPLTPLIPPCLHPHTAHTHLPPSPTPCSYLLALNLTLCSHLPASIPLWPHPTRTSFLSADTCLPPCVHPAHTRLPQASHSAHTCLPPSPAP